MKIEHAALYVRDLEAAKEFFTRWFGAQAGAEYHNRTTDFRSYFLTFEGGARLEIMTRPGLADRAGAPAVGFAHLAFSVGSKEDVDDLTARPRSSMRRTMPVAFIPVLSFVFRVYVVFP